ncbi:MAG TPA: DUF4388 domain-containing protein [Ktedonobacteraceae bacterium]
MSLIGSLEKVSLSDILQRVEAFGKTGLLKVQSGEQRAEFYFRQGQLMCLGPVHPNITLGDRLLQEGVISQEALQEVLSAIELSHRSETRMALTLIDLGHVNYDSLRIWAANEASKVISRLLKWSTGDVYFEDSVQPASERLLISLSITSLLPASLPVSVPQPATVRTITTKGQEPSNSARFYQNISPAPTAFEASQFFTKADAPSMVPSTSSWQDAPVSEPGRNTDMLTLSRVSLTPPRRVAAPVTPGRMDTSFMQPYMVLVPTDLSVQRERNPHVSLTPEQWRLFTRADGQTSLKMMCQAFAMLPEQVCQVAGELIVLGLVTISLPASGPVNELSPVSRDFIKAGLSNGYISPGHAASLAQPWSAIMPGTDNTNPFSSPIPIETQSQWGNGGNGATFRLGGGWVVAPSPSQTSQTSGPLQLNNRVYEQIGTSH